MAATEEAAPRHRSKWGQKVRKIAYLQQLVQPNGVVGLHGNDGLCQFSRVRAGDEVGQLERRGSSGTRGVRQREEGVHMATVCATTPNPRERTASISSSENRGPVGALRARIMKLLVAHMSRSCCAG